MNRPIRILHAIGSLGIGGIQSLVMNLYRNINRDKIQFDFIIDHEDDKFFEKEIKSLGGRVFFMPSFNGKNFFDIISRWNKFFKNHPEYKVLHSHIRSYASLFIPIAQKYGVTTIIHSHSTSNGKGLSSFVKTVLQYPLRYEADYFFGASLIAGEWLFGKKVVHSNRYFMLKNAVNIKAYSFNEDIRGKIRNEFSINNEIVFGHIGRLHPSKNHEFLLEIFNKIHQQNMNTKLMIVGDGALRKMIEDKVHKLGLSNSVILTGSRSDIADIFQAFDCLLFPSRWEGLPVTVVEAQAAGIPCFVSDTVTRNVALSSLVTYLPINQGSDMWVKKILTEPLIRRDVSSEIRKAGFDIQESSKWLTRFYINCIKNNNCRDRI